MIAGSIAALPFAVLLLQAPADPSDPPDPLEMLPSGLDSDERVILFPTAAALDEATQEWRVPIRVMVFEPEEGAVLRSAALAQLRHWLALEPGTEEAKTFEQRARLFLVDHERREHVQLSIGELRRRI